MIRILLANVVDQSSLNSPFVICQSEPQICRKLLFLFKYQSGGKSNPSTDTVTSKGSVESYVFDGNACLKGGY